MLGWMPQLLRSSNRQPRPIRVSLVNLGTSFAVLEVVDLVTPQVGLADHVGLGPLVLSAPGLGSGALASDTATPASHPPQATTAPEVAAVARHCLTWRKANRGACWDSLESRRP